jgi:Putative zinc-finger
MTVPHWRVSRRLVAYHDGQLPADEAGRVKLHLAECSRCESALASIRFSAAFLEQLAVIEAPPSIWTSLQATLAAPARETSWRFLTDLPRFAAAAVVALVALSIAYWYSSRVDHQWEVVHRDGAVKTGRLSVGEWIETDGTSRARVRVGSIGLVDVAPNTRVRFGAAGPDEHRLALARGLISAQISAPPRLFFVDTPASTVVDLGCAYTMEVKDAAGNGLLQVTSGWASLEWEGRESLVPAGASCATRPRIGPGTPYFDDASETLREALAAFDFGADRGGPRILDDILNESRVRDTLTLWHLLSRVEAETRGRIYDRIAALTPPPATVSREAVLKLDPETLRLWKEELAWTW